MSDKKVLIKHQNKTPNLWGGKVIKKQSMDVFLRKGAPMPTLKVLH